MLISARNSTKENKTTPVQRKAHCNTRVWKKWKKTIHRSNGSRRRDTGKIKPIQHWQTEGVKIGSINIRGLTYDKILVLLEQADVDILCIQETWMAEGAEMPELPGYRVAE